MSAARASWFDKIGPIPKDLCVCHRCDNPPCREITHLFLGTNAENLADMAAKGRSTWGTRNNTTKLTPDQVNEIRVALRGGAKQRDLATTYGVCKSTIGYINRNQTWQKLPEKETT